LIHIAKAGRYSIQGEMSNEVSFTAMRGLGCDLVELERMRDLVERRGQPFLERILTKAELDYCLQHADPIPYVAARFAGKEAVAKALGSGLGAKLGFQDISIINLPSGQPTVALSERGQAHFPEVPKLMITLSHSRTHAMAVCCWL
jgi:holo-[acyl-carrier protein] synthase